jgi:BioD-like phosphotransacetylase family protein
MKSLYIASIEEHSGKTATCLALAKYFQTQGKNVGYMKPLSLHPWRMGKNIADEDAAFVKDVLQLPENPWDLSPIVVTPGFLSKYIKQENAFDYFDKTIEALKNLCEKKDVLIVEGGDTLREGFLFGVNSLAFAGQLCCRILIIMKYHDEIHLLDDALSAKERLGKTLCGVIINRVPEEALEFIQNAAIPYLEHKNVPIFGTIPETPNLAAITIGELVTILKAQILTSNPNLDTRVETLTVGAMTADAALSRFRKQMNKGVITGGDRTDIQLAALETSTACLILTGNLHPSPLIIKQAEEFGVVILLVPTNTMETIEAIERVFGKTRLGQPVKLHEFETLFQNHVDIARLVREIDFE